MRKLAKYALDEIERIIDSYGQKIVSQLNRILCEMSSDISEVAFVDRNVASREHPPLRFITGRCPTLDN